MTLSCGVSDVGQPAVTQYRWTRNGHVIPEISDSQWNVTQVTLNYQANYSCTPVNEAGEGETATVEVEVYGECDERDAEQLTIWQIFDPLYLIINIVLICWLVVVYV